MVSTLPFKRLPRGTTTALDSRSGDVTTATTASPGFDVPVLTSDWSFASTCVPAGTVGIGPGYASRSRSNGESICGRYCNPRREIGNWTKAHLKSETRNPKLDLQ